MVTGRKANDGSTPIRHRNPPTHEWIEVINVPFEDGPPPLEKDDSLWPKRTRVWWNGVRRMPHCILWGTNEWSFALDTAHIHKEFVKKPWDTRLSAELRRREIAMGTSMDARRMLRIKYVDPKPVEEEEPVNIEDYRGGLEDRIQAID